MASKLMAYALGATALVSYFSAPATTYAQNSAVGALQGQGGQERDPNHALVVAEREFAGRAVGLEKGGDEVKAMNNILLGDVSVPGLGKMNFVQALTKLVYNPILKAAGSKEQLPTAFDHGNDVTEQRATLGLGEDAILWRGDHQGVLYPNGGIYFAANNETYPSWNNVVTGPAQFDNRPRVRQLNYVLRGGEFGDGVNNEALRIDVELLAIPNVTVPKLREIKQKMESGALNNASAAQLIEMMKPIQGRSHMFAWVPFKYDANGSPVGWVSDLNGKENDSGRQQFIKADNIAKFLNGKNAFNFTPFINHNGRDVTPGAKINNGGGTGGGGGQLRM